MDTKNSKGQALLEMLMSLALFLALWVFVQKSLEKKTKDMRQWELGHETKTKFQRNMAK